MTVKQSPVKTLLQSRKFLLLVLDVVVSLVLYFSAKYAAPSVVEDIKTVIALMQPVWVAVIVSITVQNVAEIRSRDE